MKASTKAYLFSIISVCFLLQCNLFLAAELEQRSPWQQRRSREQSECWIESLNTREPSRRIQSEAGVTEFWDNNEEQFQCAGVVASRRTIEPKGLLLPSFSNSPSLTYVVQGRGIAGQIIPGCPESFQSSQQSEQQRRRESREESRGQTFGDQHQRIFEFREGDVIAHPAGVAHWCYNEGNTPVITVTVHDTSNFQNQLGRDPRKFQIAGSQQRQSSSSYERGSSEQERSSGNIFSGFDTQSLAEALGVNRDLARKLQSQDEKKGEIIRIEQGLQVVRPSFKEEEQEQQRRDSENGLEEALCNVRLRENIDNPSHADVYSSQSGRIATLNSYKIPILNYLQLNAEKGVLHRNAMLTPHWNVNSHSIVYIIRGTARVQIVNNRGKSVFNERVRSGQMIVIPQNFVVLKQAESNGFEWVSFKTNNHAITSPLVGRNSVLRGLPEDVLMHSYRISREEARSLKYNRGQELTVLSPSSRSRSRSQEREYE